jgi:hypothetical protein
VKTQCRPESVSTIAEGKMRNLIIDAILSSDLYIQLEDCGELGNLINLRSFSNKKLLELYTHCITYV